MTAGLIAYLLLGETMGPLQIFGGAVVLIAIIWLQSRHRDRVPDASDPAPID